MQHPIAPPTELLDKWDNLPLGTKEIFVVAAQWGADQELEACCQHVRKDVTEFTSYAHLCAQSKSDGLRTARRPKPPSLKEQALGALSRADKDAPINPLTGEVVALRTILSKDQADTIRRALEQLDD